MENLTHLETSEFRVIVDGSEQILVLIPLFQELNLQEVMNEEEEMSVLSRICQHLLGKWSIEHCIVKSYIHSI